MRVFLFLAAALLALPLAGCADPDTSAPEASTTDTAEAEATPISAEMAEGRALGVGEAAPDFTLPDIDGAPTRLSTLLARGPVVLTFYRGAWCPYCNTQLRDYQQHLAEIDASGASLVAISPQVPDSSTAMQERNELSFPVLSDVGNVVSREYGIVFQVDDDTRERYEAVGIDLAKANGTDAWELPVPATYVIGTDGIVRAAFVEADYTQRASVRQILSALASV